VCVSTEERSERDVMKGRQGEKVRERDVARVVRQVYDCA
jgi:hypothetical protein